MMGPKNVYASISVKNLFQVLKSQALISYSTYVCQVNTKFLNPIKVLDPSISGFQIILCQLLYFTGLYIYVQYM